MGIDMLLQVSVVCSIPFHKKGNVFLCLYEFSYDFLSFFDMCKTLARGTYIYFVYSCGVIEITCTIIYWVHYKDMIVVVD